MLDNIELYNFKSHPSTVLNLDCSRLHALVGQNSSGKTSVLQALHYLSRLADSPFKKIFGHQRAPEVLTTSGQTHLSVSAKGFWGYQKNRQDWQASYHFEQQQENKWLPTVSWTLADETGQAQGWDSSLSTTPFPIPQALRFAVHLKLVATTLSKPAYSEAITPRVEFDGSGLAPTLDYLRSEAPDNFQSLQEMLQRIVPGVEKVGVRRAKVLVNRQRLIEVNGKSISYEESQEMTGQEVVLDMNTGERIPAHAISEGTILTLGLLTRFNESDSTQLSVTR